MVALFHGNIHPTGSTFLKQRIGGIVGPMDLAGITFVRNSVREAIGCATLSC